MSILLLLPGFVSLLYVFRKRIDVAFLSVYLPCVLVLPDYYAYRLPHLPPISAAQAALIPIGLTALLRPKSKWRPTRMDIWVVAFLVSLSLSEVTRERIPKDGVLLAVSGIISMLFPYAIGRQLIEPRLRRTTVRRWVLLVVCMLPLGAYEFRLGLSAYAFAAAKVFGLDLPWSVQIRGGHARIAMAFSDAELAGIALAMTFFLNVWLQATYKKSPFSQTPSRIERIFEKIEKKYIVGALLLLALFLTQSRGPIAAAAFGLMIVQIPKFKNVRMASVGVLVLSIVGLFAAYTYLKHYTDVTDTSEASEQQASAIYRRKLLENYQPVLAEGGWLGWGILSYPVFPSQRSIDNDFLLIQITQGRLGLFLLLAICIESLWCLAAKIWLFKNRDDLLFVFALLAALIALWITLTTVYLGEQLPQIAFLLFGWSQSVKDGNLTRELSQAREQVRDFNFKRVFS